MNARNLLSRCAFGALLAAVSTMPALAGDAPGPKPKLVVALSIDQYSSDLFAEYRPLYQDGLQKLANGVVFPRGHQSHASTETCPGHSTILTGARPARTGIVANEWFDANLPRMDGSREVFSVYCVEKPGAAGSDVRKKVISADSLKVPTLGDRMKDKEPDTRVVAVSGKDRSAVMMGGHKADLTLWWTERGFVTFAGKESSIPAEITGKLNAAVRSSFERRFVPKLPPVCASKSQKVELSATVAIGELQPTEAKSKRWRATPAMDALTVDAALAAVKAQQLGQRNVTDLLAVSLSGNDYVGHYFGTEGAEMCAQQVSLDQTIGRLFAELNKAGISYVVVLTADHGGLDAPERNVKRGQPAAERIADDLLPMNMSTALAKEMNFDGATMLGGHEFANDVYLSASIPAERRADALNLAAKLYRNHRQVETVFTRNEVIAAQLSNHPVDEWTLLERAKASFDPERSGDLIVLLKPYITTYPTPKNRENEYAASHGSPWGYDRRVPIMFWWQGITGFDQPTAVETVDIAPTLAKLIGLEVPAGEFDGRALSLKAND